MYGSHGAMHHNSGSLRRAIRSQTGQHDYPEMVAYPIDYDARYQAYGGFFKNLFGGGGKAAAGAGTEVAAGAVAEGAAKGAAKSGGGFFTGMGTGLIGVGGDLLGGMFTNKANANAMDASLKSQESIAAMKIAADKEVALAGIAQNNQGGGMGGGTIAIVAVSLLAVGGLGYLVLRKKKK